MIRIELYRGPTIDVHENPFFVGSSDVCAIKIQAPGVSAVHCKVAYQNGRLIITDADSESGTRIGSPKVDPIIGSQELPLKTWVVIGQGAWRVVSVEAVAVAPAKAVVVVDEPGPKDPDLEDILDESTGQASLLFVTGSQSGRRAMLSEGVVRIGSSTGMDIILDDAQVEPKHAQIDISKNACFVSSLAELALIECNATKVEAKQKLSHGDALKLGRSTAIYFEAGVSTSASVPWGNKARFILPDAVIIKDVLTIGNKAQSDLFLDDRQMFPDHCRIQLIRSGTQHFKFDDLSNGQTKINGKPESSKFLEDGDVIAAGQHEIRVKIIEQRWCSLEYYRVAIDTEIPNFAFIYWKYGAGN